MITELPANRKWQDKATAIVLQNWMTSVSVKALVAACPGAGKTFFAANIIRTLLDDDKVDLSIILAPTVNVQLHWVKTLTEVGIKATAEATNINLRWRKDEGVSMTEDNHVLVLTYAQLVQDSALHAELARRAGRVLLVADEIHHADDDEKTGEAVQALAERCKYTLALSGTPFNSTGGALALCDHEMDVDPETGKPIRRTIPSYTYSYGEAISDGVCRPVEFVYVYGRGNATYRRKSDGSTFQRITDLEKARKTDRISLLLDSDGEFMEECAHQAVKELADMKALGDRNAAMLVVARDKGHGDRLAGLLRRVCQAEGHSFLIQEIYNDTPKAHDRVESLSSDATDIIVSVRMISEGVDVKRLRVGLFATDWMTRMFFTQFIGRFVRYEDRLDAQQFARVIVPAHVTLLKYAEEIERMIEFAMLADGDGGDGPGEAKSELLNTETEAGKKGVMFRSEKSGKLDLAEALYRASPSAKGIPHFLAIKIAQELHLDGASPEPPRRQAIDWGRRNDQLVSALVRRLRGSGQPDKVLYEQVQSRANTAVGIKKKDSMTAEETLIRRHAFLQSWLRQLMAGSDEEDAA